MKNDPRILIERFDSKCAETGKVIKKGDECVYYPLGKKVYSLDSKAAQDFQSWAFDCQMLGANY